MDDEHVQTEYEKMAEMGMDFLPCASYNNIKRVKHVLNLVCCQYLPELQVEFVTPMKRPGLYPCSWVIHFRYMQHRYRPNITAIESLYGGEYMKNLFERIDSSKPDCTIIMPYEINFDVKDDVPLYIIEYAIEDCGCKPFLGEESEYADEGTSSMSSNNVD